MVEASFAIPSQAESSSLVLRTNRSPRVAPHERLAATQLPPDTRSQASSRRGLAPRKLLHHHRRTDCGGSTPLSFFGCCLPIEESSVETAAVQSARLAFHVNRKSYFFFSAPRSR